MLLGTVRSLQRSGGRVVPALAAAMGLASETAAVSGSGSAPAVWTGPSLRASPVWSPGNSQKQAPYSAMSAPSSNKLSDIMRTELLGDKTAEEIEEIWIKHHEESAVSEGRIGAVMTGAEYKNFMARAKASPFFVMPLQKPGGGFLTTFIQAQIPYVIITTAEEYQLLNTNAPPHLMVTHYTDYADSKDIVLVRADCINTHIISAAEARTLVALLHAFYVDPVNHLHIYNFNHDPQSFEFNKILDLLKIPRTASPTALADAMNDPEKPDEKP